MFLALLGSVLVMLWWFCRTPVPEPVVEELSLDAISHLWTGNVSLLSAIPTPAVPPPVVHDTPFSLIVARYRPLVTTQPAYEALLDCLVGWYDRYGRKLPSIADTVTREPELRFQEEQRHRLRRISLLEHLLEVEAVAAPNIHDDEAALFFMALMAADWGMLPSETRPKNTALADLPHQEISADALAQWHKADPLPDYDLLRQAVLEHHRPRPKTSIGKSIQRAITQVRTEQLTDQKPPAIAAMPSEAPLVPLTIVAHGNRVPLAYLVAWLRCELAREVNHVEETPHGPRWRALCLDKKRVFIAPESLWELIQRCPARHAAPRPYDAHALQRLLLVFARHGLMQQQDADAGSQAAILVTPRGREIALSLVVIQAASISHDPAAFVLRRDQKLNRMVSYIRLEGESS